ncbi:site-specific DNA methylase [Bifidobacterium animalis subsp. lactis ATCC 27673]|uniref:DNA (cytosine-5-)-methyltransferase n=1 Tax=Bifidobacterium animalis TaxID=28025 RepID=UPI0003B0B85D|nr:DNA (cytosine-5-)-methyltransferase [Bifidobacterium animalis]AGW84784.1 site-specific DNA methylase [Bifidobacterium animalis subsp. lactis ATCC 27673]UBZ02011.1 DNA (cytosine-5-)-methyltransferase [Bifidobacterium animalis subsp. lactis]
MTIRIAELFAGVGGFRLGLDGYHNPAHPEFEMPAAGDFETVWANQWEPNGQESKQFAWRCYESRFGKSSCVNEDIAVVLDEAEQGKRRIPEFDMVVGGFPCQDYSVAKPLAAASGIEGKKGVLWWSINKLLEMRHPKYVLLENVDRLLKSPSAQRGRDFAIILSCLYRLGYSVEWRVVNAADYGMPQRRKRVYIYAEYDAPEWNLEDRLFKTGVETRAFPAIVDERYAPEYFSITNDPHMETEKFGKGDKVSKFKEAGVMQNGHVLTARVLPKYDGVHTTLGDILVPINQVPEEFFITDSNLDSWRYLKGGKKEKRTAKTGYTYTYSEGPVAFPDPLDRPSRTILTGEGGRGASRTKHVVEQDGRLRRLVPDELDQLQMFPKGWTGDGMTDGHRAFCMGNALVTGIPHRIGQIIAEDARQATIDEPLLPSKSTM